MRHLFAIALLSACALAANSTLAAEKAAAPAAPATTMKAPASTEKAPASTDKAAATDKAANSQQNKMKECQTMAGEKKLEGKDRQAYVNDCLKAKPAKKESKMAMCNKQTAGLKGEERNKAQSECMKGG